MANPKLPHLTDAEQSILYERLNVYNRAKASYKETGCYLVVLPRNGDPCYTLWFYTPQLNRRCILYVNQLKPDLIQSLRLLTRELWYSNRPLFITDYNEKRMSLHGDDLISFGKYRGHYLYEILRIDPNYITWIAHKYTPTIPKQERFVKMAQAYYAIYLDRMLKKKQQRQTSSRPLGGKGDKLVDLTLRILHVRIEDDPFKTHVIGTTPHFYIRQRITATDVQGNLFILSFSAHYPSYISGQLSSLEQAYRIGEILHIASARIAAIYNHHGSIYTRLSYVKIRK